MLLYLLAHAAWLASSLLPLTAAASPTAPVAVPSDELKRERLPADVDFVVHLDLEGFKRTQLWKHISESAEGRAELEEELDDLREIKERLGIDPFTDVRAVTLFKVKSEEDPTVVLFSTTPEIDAALQKFQAEPGYLRVVEAGIELHSWAEDDADRAFAYLHSGPGTERVVVLASSKESAVRAARVLRGEEPNHAQGTPHLFLTPAPGSFLYLAAAEIPHLKDFTPASQVFGLAQGIQVDLGEAGGFLRGHMGVATASPEDALDISNVVNGLVSLARLAGSGMGSALELLTGIRLSTRGSEVTMDFEYGVGRLLEILEEFDGDSEADSAGPR